MFPKATVKEYLTVRKEGSREVKKPLNDYNLDMIISIGYRIKSHVATRFRIWATERLKEYIVSCGGMTPGAAVSPRHRTWTSDDV